MKQRQYRRVCDVIEIIRNKHNYHCRDASQTPCFTSYVKRHSAETIYNLDGKAKRKKNHVPLEKIS